MEGFSRQRTPTEATEGAGFGMSRQRTLQEATEGAGFGMSRQRTLQDPMEVMGFGMLRQRTPQDNLEVCGTFSRQRSAEGHDCGRSPRGPDFNRRVGSSLRLGLAPPTRDPSRWWSPLERQRAESVPELPAALRAPRVRLQEASPDDPEEQASEPIPEQVASAYASLMDSKPVFVVPDMDASGEDAQRRPVVLGVLSACTGVAASGTHNVILGLRAFLDRPEFEGSRLVGLRHLSNGWEFDIESKEVRHFLNQGGSDLLTTLPLSRVNQRMLGQLAKLCDRLSLNGLLFLCGPSELAQIVKIAEHFAKEHPSVPVAAVVHSLSGWVRVPGWMHTNLGFDSAVRVLAEVSGNIALSRSSLTFDLYHFLCLGSPALTLEVALQIRPTLCYLGVDVAQRGLTLQEICDEICDVIVARHHEHGLHTGEIVISDDLLEQLSEMRELREELHRIRMERPAEMRSEEAARQMLPPKLGTFFELLPADVRHDLVFRNGIDGLPLLNAQEMERELGSMVARNLARKRQRGERSIDNFAHFPRSTKHLAVSPMPSPMDCALGYTLGHTAGALLTSGATGYAASVPDVGLPPEEWKPCGVPLVRFLQSSSGEPLIKRRRLVDDAAFGLWSRVRDQWRFRLSYRQPGPVQFWGPGGKTTAWMPYTTWAQCGGGHEFEEEVREASRVDKAFSVQLRTPFRLVRRREALLSPLQRWRGTYRPRLPDVLQGNFRILEDDRRGRVCADPRLLSTAFPSLWRSGQLKHVIVQTEHDEVSVLQMLPERSASINRIDSWGAVSGGSNSGGSGGAEAGVPFLERAVSVSKVSVCPPDDEGVGLDFDFDMKNTNLRIGVAVVGRAGPGMNNVIQGIYDYLQKVDGTVVCIAMGIAGLVGGHAFELTEELLGPHRNQGGCDLLGQSQPEDIPADILHQGDNLTPCAATVKKLELDGLVVWGGRNVHSWTAQLAEYFVEHQVPTRVIGVPASVEADLPLIEQTLGHDTVCRLFASIVGNLATQAASSGMQWCFVRIPGRSISHIAAEVALETIPHVVLVTAEMNREEMGLSEVTQKICNVIEARSREDMNYGVVIIPDQFMAAVREMQQLFTEMQQIREACPEALEGVEQGVARDFGPVLSLLPPLSRALFQSFPERVRTQICLARGEGLPKGAVDLAGVETEVIFKTLVETELTRRVVVGTYKGPFQCRTYSLPYHGRATMPTNFDCDLGYTIGYAASIFVNEGRTGLLVDVTKLKEDVSRWEVGGIPFSSLLSFQEPAKAGCRPTGEIRPKGRLTYDQHHEQTMPEPCHRTLVNPGPAQYEGPCANVTTQTLCMPQLQRVRQMALTDQLITDLKTQASAGCPPEVLQAVRMLLQGGVDLLRIAQHTE